MKDYIESNREMWDVLAKAHTGSEFYDVKGFLDGKQTLDPIEVEELPDLTDKRLIHLMCHFGIDTLSLARMGADVTGVDFSPEAIRAAKELSKTAGINARFVCANVYDVPEVIKERFDVVFTSGGVLVWLPNLEKWAKVINSLLRPGGFFYIREFHPFAYVFDDEAQTELRVRFPYFMDEEPLMFEGDGSYAVDGSETGKTRSYEWNHSISKIINALTGEGLRIDYFNEFAETSYKALPFMVQREDGRWVLPTKQECVPLMFSLKATKPT
ncbi:MAG: class I SAM-dependent methyltransferase [Candidatus Thorarchaeota archaeon]